MPTFRPPLGSASIALCVPDDSPLVQLTFLAELADKETLCGRYELWTDLPDLDATGHERSPPGEWHAISYESITSADQPLLAARPILHSREGTFSYTLRMVKESGEVVWLGSGGDNGRVEMKVGEVSRKIYLTSCPWTGKIQDQDEVGITSIAVDEDVASPEPYIKLPRKEPTISSIVLARVAHDIRTAPFSDIVVRNQTMLGNIRTEYIAVSPTDSSCVTTGGATLPIPDETSQCFRAPSLTELVELVNDHQKALAGYITLSDIAKGKIVPSSDTEAAHFILINDSLEPRSIPVSADLPKPVVITMHGHRTYYPGNAKIDILTDAGLTASPLTVHPFTVLRDTGFNASLMLCAPCGKVLEQGEEEVEDDARPIVHIPASPAQHARILDKLDTHRQQQQLEQLAEEGEGEGDDEDTESSALEPIDSVDEEGEPISASSLFAEEHGRESLVQWAGRLILKVWSWILWPLGLWQPGDQIQGGNEDEDMAGRKGASGGQVAPGTPATERTPLLSTPGETPGLSRSTSTSTMTPLASPEHAFTISLPSGPRIKSDQKNDADPFLDTGNTLNRGASQIDIESTAGAAVQPTVARSAQFLKGHKRGASAPHVIVKSYMRFSFSKANEAVFWLHSAKGPVDVSKLSFSARRVTDTAWKDVEVEDVTSMSLLDGHGQDEQIMLKEGEQRIKVALGQGKGEWLVQVSIA